MNHLLVPLKKEVHELAVGFLFFVLFFFFILDLLNEGSEVVGDLALTCKTFLHLKPFCDLYGALLNVRVSFT